MVLQAVRQRLPLHSRIPPCTQNFLLLCKVRDRAMYNPTDICFRIITAPVEVKKMWNGR